MQTYTQTTLAEKALSPVVRELPADLETPISVYLKLAGQGPSFLLESVTGGEQVARYSFIGVNPGLAYVLRGAVIERHSAEGTQVIQLEAGSNPLDLLRLELARSKVMAPPGLPRFIGGLAGYMSYELVRYLEPSVSLTPHPDIPEAIFLLADTLVAFDHAFGKLVMIAIPRPGNGASPNAEAESRLDELQARLEGPSPDHPRPPSRFTAQGQANTSLSSNVTQAEFTAAVRQAKEHIAAGDIFQVVLSQRLSRTTDAAPFDIYRALRRLNPSPYMYYFDFGDLGSSSKMGAGADQDEQPLRLIGASPEMHVRLEGRRASLRPIAGTRPRGATPQEDHLLEDELLADPKECAEHIMLVDLGRNDLGRVCDFGSVRVSEQMGIERYSHVMHIVSHIEGSLRPGLDAFDLMHATFPAGTVSGAPKIRAMQIIQELEKGPRGPYAGAVGYFSFDGSMDTCITIRTLVMHGQEVSIQAGAGIVADSEPDREYQETLNKARALAVAVEIAESRETNGAKDRR